MEDAGVAEIIMLRDVECLMTLMLRVHSIVMYRNLNLSLKESRGEITPNTCTMHENLKAYYFKTFTTPSSTNCRLLPHTKKERQHSKHRNRKFKMFFHNKIQLQIMHKDFVAIIS
ncbi:hypothetical protein AAHE18_11G066500 [Arachis hypogaea]